MLRNVRASMTSPLRSNRPMISPTSPRRTASGLINTSVRSDTRSSNCLYEQALPAYLWAFAGRVVGLCWYRRSPTCGAIGEELVANGLRKPLGTGRVTLAVILGTLGAYTAAA